MRPDGNFLGIFLDWGGVIGMASAAVAVVAFFFRVLNTQAANSKNIDELYDDTQALRKDLNTALTDIRAELSKVLYSLGRLEGKLGIYNNDVDQRSGTV